MVCLATAAAAPRVTVGLVDVRPPGADAAGRRPLQAALADRREIAVVDDADLSAALAGEDDGAARAAAEQSVARAEGSACPGAAAEATQALAAVGQAYDPDADAGAKLLARALAVELRCADGAGDRAVAQRAAGRIRALGGDLGPLAVRYPQIDAASNVARQPLQVTTDPPGARVFIDYVYAGVAPLEKTVAPGPHQVTASAPGRSRATLAVEVKEGRAGAASLALGEAKASPRSPLRARVRGWRGGEAITAEGLALAMREAGLGLAVVWNGAKAQIWSLTDKGTAIPLEEVAPADAASVAAAAARHAGGVAAAGVPAEPEKKGRTWWIYAVALGAAGAALGVVLLSENGSKTQRIEVKWP